MKNKILLLGHPHSGSSLLKSLLGHSPNAHEIINETQRIDHNQLVKGKICVAKTPLFSPIFNLNKLQDHQTVLLIRNPCFALMSLEARFKDLKIPKDHKQFFTIEYWEWYLNQYINWKGIKIRYQDIFTLVIFTKVFNEVGLEVPEDIYGNYEKRISDIDIPKEEPKRTDHLRYRQFQINQKVEYKDKNKVIPQGGIYDDIKNLDSYKKIFLE